MPKAKAPFKVEVNIVGPCFPSYGSSIDQDYRQVKVEVRVKHENKPFSEDYIYYLLARICRSLSSRTWYKTVYHAYPEIAHYLDHISLHDAEKVVKILKRFNVYVDKLPIKPGTIDEYLMAIGKFHNIELVDLYIYSDTFTRCDQKPGAYLSQAIYLVKQAVAGLVPEGEETVD